jgi:hypothetical protein
LRRQRTLPIKAFPEWIRSTPSANVHIASTINFNARDVYPDNYSPGEVANHQWLKDKVGTKIILFLVVI